MFPARLRPHPCFAFAFRFSTLIVFPGVNPSPNLKTKLRVSLGLTPGYKIFIYKTVKDLSLNVHDDNHLLHLVSDSQRLSFSQELTPTLTLGLSLGLALGLAGSHFQDKYFFVSTRFKDFSLNIYDDTNLLHLISDSQRLSFSQELSPNPNPRIKLRVRLGVSLGSLPG